MNRQSTRIRMFRSGMAIFGVGLIAALFGDIDPAYAAKMSDTINSAGDNIELLPKLVSVIAYILGASCVGIGLFKLRDYSNNPQQVKISDPLKYLFAGGLLVASPAFANVLINTFGFLGGDLRSTGGGAVAAPGGPATRLDEMIIAFMKDISGPLGNLISAFAYIAGAILTVVGLHRLTKSSQEGPRGPSGMGTMGTFVSAAVLLSSSQVLSALTITLFGTDEVFSYAEIFGFDSAAPAQNASNVITSILAFMMIVGVISFLRGVFVLRGFTDGNSQMTLMGGLSHIIAGVLAINLGPLINAIQETLGVNVLGHGIRFTAGAS